MVKKIVFLLLLSGSVLTKTYAQDPGFTQFYANPLYLNPAFAGTASCPRFTMNYRNEWPGLNNAYVTYSASYDQHVENLSGGVGLLVTSDRAGDGTLTTNRVSGIYSYRLNINRFFSMDFGLEGTYHQKSLDWSKLTFGDMIDKRRGFVWNTNEIQVRNKAQSVDISAGILGYSKRYYFGVATHHINQPEEGFINANGVKLPMKITAHAGAMIPLEKGKQTFISPNILYQRQQDFQQLNLGLYFVKNSIVGGVWYRNQDAFIVLIGFQNNNFKFGYSYDITVSKLSNVSAGSHEISMQIQFECKPKKKKFRTVSCPSF
jgi:type IX secretion system PorP/SprF family membrane protein